MTAPSSIIGLVRILDVYSFKARLSPVFLVVMPLLLRSLVLVPSLPAWNKLWPLLGGARVILLVDSVTSLSPKHCVGHSHHQEIRATPRAAARRHARCRGGPQAAVQDRVLMADRPTPRVLSRSVIALGEQCSRSQVSK
jgi:hypothetical protein